MANNEYVNKVEYGNTTVMDITDTTAEAEDVIENKVFYAKSGARSVGLLGDATQSTHGLMSVADKTKLDGIDLLGIKLDSSAITPDANGYVNIPIMTGATSSVAGSAGLVPAPATTDVDKFLAGDGTYKSGGLPMVILSYGKNTWAEFMEAYNNHVIVYCRASSSSNPASGQQLRMAFMAYVAGSADNPTEVEFQYYRSVNAHSATQMGDQVFVYKLTNKGVWSVTTREASPKQFNVSGGGLSTSWSSNQVTFTTSVATTSANGMMSSTDKSRLDELWAFYSDNGFGIDSSGYITQTL